VEPFDRSQSVNFSYYILLPDVGAKYMGNHKAVNGILDGWRISGIEQYGSGTPFTDVAQGTPNHNEYSGNQSIGIYGTLLDGVGISNDSVTGTPDESAVPIVTCNPAKGLKPHQYFNPSCLSVPSEGQNGSFKLPYIHGPAYFNDEIGLFKDFKIRESQRFEVRFQGFNFLNRGFDTYEQYDSSLYLDYTGTASPSNAATAGVTTVRTGHRTVQLEGKYYF
jgi:hypothetical protein